MADLKDCKCGCSPRVYADHETHGMAYYTQAEVWCPNPDCDVTPNPIIADTTAEAIAAWNTRADTRRKEQ